MTCPDCGRPLQLAKDAWKTSTPRERIWFCLPCRGVNVVDLRKERTCVWLLRHPPSGVIRAFVDEAAAQRFIVEQATNPSLAASDRLHEISRVTVEP